LREEAEGEWEELRLNQEAGRVKRRVWKNGWRRVRRGFVCWVGI
jgi:hypothetical protein